MTIDHKEPAKLIEQRRLKVYADIRQRRKIAGNDNSRLETFAQVILFMMVMQLVVAILYGILVVVNFATKDATTDDTIFKTAFLVTIVVFFLLYLPVCILGIKAWWSLYEMEHLKFAYSAYVPYFIILNCLFDITPNIDSIIANKCISQWDNKFIAIVILAILSVQITLCISSMVVETRILNIPCCASVFICCEGTNPIIATDHVVWIMV